MTAEENKAPEGSVKSPFVPVDKEYDLDEHRDKTGRVAALKILEVFAKNGELLIPKTKHDKSLSPEEVHAARMQKSIDGFSIVAQEVMNVIVECKVADCDMQALADDLQNVTHFVFNIIKRQKTEFEQEYLARMIGTRNPATGKYDRRYATLEDLIVSLHKKREADGDNGEDYFFIEKKEPKQE